MYKGPDQVLMEKVYQKKTLCFQQYLPILALSLCLRSAAVGNPRQYHTSFGACVVLSSRSCSFIDASL